ncbi:hypothetical protein WJX82_005570 [Trebouxia sp. C0006]
MQVGTRKQELSVVVKRSATDWQLKLSRCGASFAGTGVMKEVYIKDRVDPYVLEVDGILDLAPLQLQPPSIVINRKGGLKLATLKGPLQISRNFLIARRTCCAFLRHLVQVLKQVLSELNQVDLTGVVTECPQHLEMPRPVHFQWDEHESTHMSEAVDWLDQHLCPVEAKSAYNLDSLSENLMLMMLPFVVGLYELKTTKDLEERLSRNQAHGMITIQLTRPVRTLRKAVQTSPATLCCSQ